MAGNTASNVGGEALGWAQQNPDQLLNFAAQALGIWNPSLGAATRTLGGLTSAYMTPQRRTEWAEAKRAVEREKAGERIPVPYGYGGVNDPLGEAPRDDSVPYTATPRQRQLSAQKEPSGYSSIASSTMDDAGKMAVAARQQAAERRREMLNYKGSPVDIRAITAPGRSLVPPIQAEGGGGGSSMSLAALARMLTGRGGGGGLGGFGGGFGGIGGSS